MLCQINQEILKASKNNRVALYFKAILNSIDFYKEIFLHVIPVRIIVPWRHLPVNTWE